MSDKIKVRIAGEMRAMYDQVVEMTQEEFARLDAMLDDEERSTRERAAIPEVRFVAACSGLQYENPMACGEVSAVIVGGNRFDLPAAAVPEGLQLALEEVREVLQRSYQNASPVCCGQGRGGECCGSPAPDWSEDGMFIMDRLGIAEKHLSAMLT